MPASDINELVERLAIVEKCIEQQDATRILELATLETMRSSITHRLQVLREYESNVNRMTEL